MVERDDFKRGYWSRVEIPTRMQIFFLLIFVYKLTSTNSYNTNCITNSYTIIQNSTNSYNYTNCIVLIHTIRTFFYTNCILRIHTTTRARSARRGRSPSRERAARAARAKPEHTSCPDQAAPGCPDVRVHPAAPMLGYTRLPRC
jgi:hypothetical protein